MEALAPPQRGEQQRREGVTLNHMVSGCPLSCREQADSHAEGPGSRAPPDYQEVIRSDLNIIPARETRSARAEEEEQDSNVEFQDSREVLPSRSLADSIAVPRLPQATLETNNNQLPLSRLESHMNQTAEYGESLQVLDSESGAGAIGTANLIEDAKFYQDTALEYQDANETLITTGRVATLVHPTGAISSGGFQSSLSCRSPVFNLTTGIGSSEKSTGS